MAQVPRETEASCSRSNLYSTGHARSGWLQLSLPRPQFSPLMATDTTCPPFVDATSVEVFADDGLVVFTDQIFPSPTSRGVSLFATGGAARLRSLEAWELRP